MSLRNIYEQLGMEPEYDKEVAKLNNRIILIVDDFNLFFYKQEANVYKKLLPSFIRKVAFLIGESNIQYIRSLKDFFKSNRGTNTLQENILNLNCLLEVSRQVLKDGIYWNLYDFLAKEAKRAIESPPIDIGYLFSGDTIIKKGARELDEKLILENLAWLSKFPTIKQSFENTLKDYLRKDYPDAITNAYGSLEGLVKTFLNKDKRLDTDETRKELIKKVGLEDDWGQLLYNYSKLAHEFSSRHGKKETGEKLELAPELVEFYIYITGTFMRLILTLSAKSNKG